VPCPDLTGKRLFREVYDKWKKLEIPFIAPPTLSAMD
jgi:hypothetical protein